MTHNLSDVVLEAEIAALRERYGEFPLLTARVEMGPTALADYRRQLERRRGEILLVLARPTGEVLMHTKRFYPPGVYRLPTGGIDWHEAVPDAWRRELWEETQLTSADERLLGVIGYEFVGRRANGEPDAVPFVSFVFQQANITGDPHPLDESEEITDFRWIPRAELTVVANELDALDRINADTADWGRFRAVAHRFVHDADW
jgi:8-oxo-dGTP pyrophosphatase MutT (NUDIX family)